MSRRGTKSQVTRPYHHGRLREVVLESAIEEIEAVGAARLSMREIAKRAGVSHAAPAHHFGDKAGIFTAIATRGYQLLYEAGIKAADGPNAFINAGIAYITFALSHRAYFEVMFRPDLCHADDPELVAARDRSFGVLFGLVEHDLGPGRDELALPTSVAAWAIVHGFATLWLSGNLEPRFGEAVSFESLVPQLVEGFVALGEIAARGPDPSPSIERRDAPGEN
jgi:AcrR family transcriptional regulator